MIYSFWPISSTPPVLSIGALGGNNAIMFTPWVNGSITAIRYWRINTDTASPHVARIWLESTQAEVANVTFSGETASGWQSATLGTPYAVTAGTRYRISINHTGSVAYLPEPGGRGVAGRMSIDPVRLGATSTA